MSIKKFPKIIEFLKKEEKTSLNRIAKYIKADRRTTIKIVEVASQLKLIKLDKFKSGDKVYIFCELTEEYQKILENVEKSD